MLVIKVGYIMPAVCGMCLCVRNLPSPAQGVSLNPCLAVEVNAFKEEWFAEPLRNAMLSKLKRFAWIMKKVLCFRGIDFLVGEFVADGVKW